MSQLSSPTKNYMDGTLMSLLHGNLNRLSDKSWKGLLNYYATGIVTLETESSLLSDLIEPSAM